MKKLLFVLAVVCSFQLRGQLIIDGKDINADDNIQIIHVSGTWIVGLVKPKFIFAIDYGQKVESKQFSAKEQMIKDKDGAPQTFNSVMDGINFLIRNGWAYVNSYISTGAQESFTAHNFILIKQNK